MPAIFRRTIVPTASKLAVLAFISTCLTTNAIGESVCTETWTSALNKNCSIDTSRDVSRCINSAHADAESELQWLYQELKSKLAARDGLVTAERAWIRFRQSECAFQASQNACETPGSGKCKLLQAGCEIKLACDRVVQLRELLQTRCPECLAARKSESRIPKDLVLDFGGGDSVRIMGQADSFPCDDPTYANVEKVVTATLVFADGKTETLCRRK